MTSLANYEKPPGDKPIIIGLSGTNASGKDTLAEYLRDKHEFVFYHTSNVIRAEASRRYGNILRPTLFKVGNELRAEGGAGVLVEQSLEKYRSSNMNVAGIVISSIRTLGEVKALKVAGGILVFIDANRRTRYQRLKARQRADDVISYQKFIKQEEAEMHQSDDPAEFNISGVAKMADACLDNSASVNEFITQAEAALNLSA